MKNGINYLDFIIYWSIALIPFSIAISPVPTSVFMGLLIAAFVSKKIMKREHGVTKTAINAPLLFFFVLTCISIIHSINYPDSLKGGIFRLLEYILLLLIIVEELKDKNHLNKIILSITIGILLSSLDALWQVATGKDFMRGYAPVVNIGLVRATASFKDSNLLGIYLSAFMPILLGLTLYYFTNKKRILFILVTFIALVGIILTYSRPTLLAMYLVLLFLGIAKRNRILIGLLILFMIISPFIIPKSVKNWAKEVEYNPLRFMCNDDRIAVYRNSLNMIKAHPFIGLGPNTYMKNYKKYKEFPEYRNIVTLDYMYAHNMYLQMAAEIGLIGLTIFIWLLFALLAEMRNIYRSLNDYYLKVVILSLSACVMAFLVNGLTESSLYYSRVAMIFWYLAGISLSLKNSRFCS